MFYKFTAAAIAATMALCAGPAAAAPVMVSPPPVRMSQASAEAAVADWMARVARWGQGYADLTASRVETLGWMIEAPGTLAAKLTGPEKSRTREWAATWATQARARLAAEMATYQGLSTDFPDFPRSIPTTPDHQARLRSMEQTADRTGRLMIVTGQACEEYIQLIEAGASGEQSDLERLDLGFFKLMIAYLQAEIVLAEGTQDLSRGPNRSFATSQIETNRAMIAWLSYSHDAYLGQGDGAEAAARIRTHAANVKAAAQEMFDGVGQYEREMNADPQFRGTALAATFTQVFESLRESAQVENQLGHALEALATGAAAGDEAATTRATTRIEQLTIRRGELDQSRRAMLAQAST